MSNKKPYHFDLCRANSALTLRIPGDTLGIRTASQGPRSFSGELQGFAGR